MKKITILSLHLGYGGIEKCVCQLANNLVKNYNVEILSLYKLYNEPAFKLDKNVNVRYLMDEKPNREDFKYAIRNFKFITAFKEGLKALKILKLKKKKTIDAIDSCDSDIIISTRIFFNKLLGEYKNDRVHAIGWEHNHHHDNKKYIKKFRNSCKRLDEVVVVSENLKDYYKKDFKKHNISCKVIFIPNYIDNIDYVKSKYDTKDIIAVGRLSKEKGFSDLIDVFSIVNKYDKNIKLYLVGDGSEKKKILDKVINYKLTNVVKMKGFLSQEEIHKLESNCCLYVMSSFTESFGLVLIEAMSHSIGAIAFDSAEGARDLITNGSNGYLIKNRNKEKMALKIVELVNNKNELKRIGKNAKILSESYLEDNVIKIWNEFLDSIK